MDAFESVISMLLRREGYWTISNFKVELTKDEKQQIGRHTTPRWELDLIADNGLTNKVLVVECKSFLDSTGVTFRDGLNNPPKTELPQGPWTRERKRIGPVCRASTVQAKWLLPDRLDPPDATSRLHRLTETKRRRP